jgi:transposase
MSPGKPRRYDYEYRRNGVANVFMMFEPLTGKRHLKVTERRTKKDWAYCIRHLVDEVYPDADSVVLVMDNLNTHKKASLYEAFEPSEAKRIADKLEIHYTPKHGSWLNMAEIEMSVMGRQCLAERMGSIQCLESEALAWAEKRNTKQAKVDWRFTTADARIKLKKLYPSIEA